MPDPSNRPPFRIQINGKGENKHRNLNAGVAFRNKVGGLTLFLAPGVVIDHQTSNEFFVNVNPVDEAHGGPPRQDPLGDMSRSRGAEADTFDRQYEDDDDIPF